MRRMQFVSGLLGSTKFRAVSLLSAVGALVLLIRRWHKSLLYPAHVNGQSPRDNPCGYRNPAESELQYKQVEVRSGPHRLRGWHVSPSSKPLLVYFQQNAGNIGWRIPFIKQLVKQLNVSVLLVAYRGYSDSEGTPSQAGLKQDSLAILNYVRQKELDRDGLFLFGRSLGGAVAIYAASQVADQQKQKLKGLVLQNTFTSVHDVLKDTFKLPHLLSWILVPSVWPSIQTIKKVEVPVLFVMTKHDELIPVKHMQQLSDKLEQKKEVLVIQKGGHNGSWALCEEYFPTLSRFLRRYSDGR